MDDFGSTTAITLLRSKRRIDEMEHLALEYGITSFKIFMFYGGYGLHGRSTNQNDFLMIGPEERYDIAHFEFIMRAARRLMTAHPQLADHVSVSLHCELADILTTYTKIVEREGKLTGLQAYSAARPNMGAMVGPRMFVSGPGLRNTVIRRPGVTDTPAQAAKEAKAVLDAGAD